MPNKIIIIILKGEKIITPVKYIQVKAFHMYGKQYYDRIPNDSQAT